MNFETEFCKILFIKIAREIWFSGTKKDREDLHDGKEETHYEKRF